ncbi:ASKHA domain-containing protein [Maritalea sp.]|uniref:ASKHA domain-containing protein n=1 Tax=Maritalea sp. TaxID=2003361 RepID=UPI003EF37E13
MSAQQKDALVVFQPSGHKGRFPIGTPLLDAARDLGVYVESVCGGRGICGKCQVSVAEGNFAKFNIDSREAALSEKGFKEQRYEEKRGLDIGHRLSCSATLQGDVVLEIPDAFKAAGQTIRKDADTIGMVRKPAVRLYYVEVEQPDMHNPLGDADRLCKAVSEQFGLGKITVAHRLKSGLQKLLRKSDWQVTVAIHNPDLCPEIVSIWPGYSENVSGLAVDIGSTTIAAHLTDLMSGEILASAGVANPQIRFGEDLMSRVSYVMMNDNGQQNLTKSVVDAVNKLIDQLLETAQRNRNELLDSVFVANPVMHHLFLGWDPTEIGQAPFALVQSEAVHCSASDIGLNLAEGASVYLLPLIAGHVGADAAAVMLAQHPETEPHPTLVVDVGTNAEIALWDGNQLLAASSPTGPAFEGAETSCGQRAAPGAIERIRIDRDTLKTRYKIIGPEEWSDHPDFEEKSKVTGVTGICGSGIIEIIGEMVLAGILATDGIIRAPQNEAEEAVLKPNGRTWSFIVREGTPHIEVTQNDVRAIQLAKAALYAGVKLLMQKSGITKVGEIRLAGAFGSYIDPAYAMLLGLVPDCEVDKVTAVGNAAGQGALIALLDVNARERIEQTVHEVTKIETALEADFQDLFVAAMGLPNSVDEFALTREHFKMPEFTPPDSGGESGRPRRRGRNRSR